VELSREASWATIRDKLAVGALDGAHMLAPMAIAQTLGLGCEPTPMVAPLTLAADAAAVTVSARLGIIDDPGAEALAALVARRREMGASPLTFGLVYPFSTHNYLLRLWMAQGGLDPDRDVRLTVAPPPRMAGLLSDGVIEGFCAGEPWNAVAVAGGAGVVAVRAPQIVAHAPDKVLGVTAAWAAANPSALRAVLRATLRGLAFAQAPENRRRLALDLSAPDYLGVSSELIAQGLASATFHGPSAGRPQPGHATWLLEQMRRWGQVRGDAAAAEAVYRPDLYDDGLAVA
jgi:NitT/TauT family transport system ATP-binding protein/nitrate/nitrite transport system substrate-binding protein